MRLPWMQWCGGCGMSKSVACILPLPYMQVWSAERSTQLGLAVSSMLKGYTNTAAKYTGLILKSVAKFGLQVRGRVNTLRAVTRNWLFLGLLSVCGRPGEDRGVALGQ